MSEIRKAGAFVSGLVLLIAIALLVVFFLMSKSSEEGVEQVESQSGSNGSVSASKDTPPQESKDVKKSTPAEKDEEDPTEDGETPSKDGKALPNPTGTVSKVYNKDYTVTKELDLSAKVLEKNLLDTEESYVSPEIVLQILDDSGNPKGVIKQGVNFKTYEALSVGDLLEVKVNVLDKDKLVVTSLKKHD